MKEWASTFINTISHDFALFSLNEAHNSAFFSKYRNLPQKSFFRSSFHSEAYAMKLACNRAIVHSEDEL